MSGNKQMVKIYKVLNSDIKTNAEYIDTIVNSYNLKSESKFKNISEKQINNYFYKIYYQKREKEPDWVELVAPLLEEKNEILDYENVYNSLNIFIYNDNSIYLITKGHGNYFLKEYVDSQFGIDIALRIANEYNEIKSISEINMFGKVKNEDIEYRTKESFIGIDNFGKKINNLNINLKIDNIQYLGDNLGILDSNLEAGSYFLLRRSITFDQIMEFIKNFDKILKLKPIFETSLIEIRGKSQKEDIKDHFCEEIKKYIDNKTNNTNYFEFMSAKVEEYRLAKYCLKYNRKTEELEDIELNEIIEKVKI